MNFFQKLNQARRMIGWANIYRSVRYTARRKSLDARDLPPARENQVRRPGDCLGMELIAGGVQVKFQEASLEIHFLMPGLIFLGWDGAGMQPSYAVLQQEWERLKVDFQETPAGWEIHSPGLTVQVGQDGTQAFLTPDGGFLRRQDPPAWQGEAWSQRAALLEGEGVFGLGERAGRLDLRPGRYRFWNSDAGGVYGPGADPLYICMPLYLSFKERVGCLSFHDNPWDGSCEINHDIQFSFTGGPARQYLAFADLPGLMKILSRLTGLPPMPPRWALGYQQSRWGFRNEAEMRRIYAGFKQRNLPLSALVADIDLQPGFRTLTVDRERFPSLADFSRQLSQDDVHLVAILDPGVKVDAQFDLYRDGLAQDVFCKTRDGRVMEGVVWPGWSAFPDFTHPRVREWWGRQYSRLLSQGIRGFWHDMNEPSCFTSSGDMTLPLSTRHDLDGQGGDHRAAHNVYGLNMIRAGFEGLRKLAPERRPFVLSRSGWVGMQRYAWTWTGDIESSWGIMRQTIACVIGLGLCGVAYAGPDIGGFTHHPGAELYLRWFQMAAFLPFFRTHSSVGLPPREPWEFGEEVLDILRKSLALRYCLLPFWYTLAWQNSQTGLPLIRPLFWLDPADAGLRGLEDEFLVGEVFLVAPVCQEGARERKVFLPSGTWYAWDTKDAHEGGQEVTVAAPLDRLPLFVRAGSLLALESEGRLILQVYRPEAGQAGRGELYTDDGDGYGESCLHRFFLEPRGDSGFQLTWQRSGEFPWPYAGITLELIGFQQASVNLGKRKIPLVQGEVHLPVFEEITIEGR